ncbi:MAG TPA: methyltransferase domain-containing protein [Candidatus Aquicultor sp.]
MSKKHVVLIGLNFGLERNTGDKNFWVELIPFLAAGLERITIFSVKPHAVPEEELTINNCALRVKYLTPRFLEVPGSLNKRPNIFWRRGKFPSLLGVVEKLLNTKRLKKELELLYNSCPYSYVHLMDNFGITNRLIANNAKAPVSVSAMAYQGRKPEWLYKLYLRISYGQDNLTVIPYSKSFEKRLIEQGFEQRRIRRIPWGIKPVSLNSNRDNTGSRKPLILWAGYIQQTNRNDFEFAYRVAKRSLAQGLDATFIFAFKPESFEDGLESYNDPSNNIVVRPTTSKEFQELQHTANVFLSPITNSKCILAPPLTWLEMLSVGAPIVTLDIPGASEAVVSRETGYLATSEEDIMQKLFLAIENSRYMRDKCIDLVERRYSLVDISKEYLALFNDFTRDSCAKYRAREHYQDKNIATHYDSKRFVSIKGRVTDWLEINTIQKALKATNVGGGAKILDIPCGTGRLSLHLAEQGYFVTGGDISRAMLDVAEEKVRRLQTARHVDFHQVEAEKLAFPNAAYDAVISLRLLGHVPPSVRLTMLREFARVSKRYVVLAYYCKECLQGLLRRSKRRERNIPWYPISLNAIDKELVAAGLKRVRLLPMALGISETLIVLAEKGEV